ELNGVIPPSPSNAKALFVNQQFIDNISNIEGAMAPGNELLVGTRHVASSLARFAGQPADPDSFLCDSLGERLHGVSAGCASRNDGADADVAASVSAGLRASPRRLAAVAARSLHRLVELNPPAYQAQRPRSPFGGGAFFVSRPDILLNRSPTN